VRAVYQRINRPPGSCAFPMGNRGRSWIGLFSFLALAILMAALGPSTPASSPVVDVVEADVVTAHAVAPAVDVVASR